MNTKKTSVAELGLMEQIIHFYYFRDHLDPAEIASQLACSTAAVVRVLCRIETKLGQI